MSWLFEAVFEAALHHRLARWIVIAIIALIALWFRGFASVDAWLFIGLLLGLALLAEIFDRLLGRGGRD